MYLKKDFFSEQVILIDKEATTQAGALKLIADVLQEKGIVTPSFYPAILAREEKYSTGLTLSDGTGVAIPHTDTDKVNKNQIGFISLSRPISFKQMGDPTQNVEVNMIFMLCLKNADEQLDMLQNLMQMFSDTEMMKRVREVKTKEAFNRIFQ